MLCDIAIELSPNFTLIYLNLIFTTKQCLLVGGGAQPFLDDEAICQANSDSE